MRRHRLGTPANLYARLFLPGLVREDLRALSAYGTRLEQLSLARDKEGFYSLKNAIRSPNPSGEKIADEFRSLANRHSFPDAWIAAQLTAAEMDMHKKRYRDREEFDAYLKGACDAPGLMSARIAGLPAAAEPYAAELARAMHLVHLIADIPRDSSRERTYFDSESLRRHGLRDLSYAHTRERPGQFSRFIREQLSRAQVHFDHGSHGLAFVPRRYLPPLAAAIRSHTSIAKSISSQPFSIYSREPSAGAFSSLLAGIRAGILG